MTPELILTLIQSLLIGWFIPKFEPLHTVLELLPDTLFKWILQSLFTCMKCTSFWACLILTQNLYLAITAAFLGFWYDKLIGPEERKIRF